MKTVCKPVRGQSNHLYLCLHLLVSARRVVGQLASNIIRHKLGDIRHEKAKHECHAGKCNSSIIDSSMEKRTG